METNKNESNGDNTGWLPSVGDTVFIRTVTHYYTGKIDAMNAEWISLKDAAWVADTGRFNVAMSAGTLSEVEPYLGPCAVSRGAIVDTSLWDFPLPREVLPRPEK